MVMVSGSFRSDGVKYMRSYGHVCVLSCTNATQNPGWDICRFVLWLLKFNSKFRRGSVDPPQKKRMPN